MAGEARDGQRVQNRAARLGRLDEEARRRGDLLVEEPEDDLVLHAS